MLFNSYIFIFAFLPIALIVFWQLAKAKLRQPAQIWLVCASLFFYGYWNPAYLPLILISIFINFQLGKYLSNSCPKNKLSKALLVSGLCINLGFLAYYKYAFFITSSIPIPQINQLVSQFNLDDIVLPLAISFFTFQQISYLVDAYHGETKEYNFLNYCLFVTFFPQLIAGPIVHHKDIIPQFYRLRNFVFSHRNFALGLTLFVLGLSKKVLIADRLSPLVNVAFTEASSLGFMQAWVGALNYTFQLYFDFSGYSDMAVGLGLMFNINLPVNFNSPYKALSISDFWRRWHITLSNFLRDYVYIPLGGNRKGKTRQYANLLITMLLGGLWHGAGWTFILWGGLHGVFLIIHHWWRTLNIPLPKVVCWLITFLAIVLTWVIFRAHSLQDSIEMLTAMAGIKGFEMMEGGKRNLLALAALTLSVVLLPNTNQILKWLKPNIWWAVGISGMAVYSLLSLNQVSEFLYFQF